LLAVAESRVEDVYAVHRCHS